MNSIVTITLAFRHGASNEDRIALATNVSACCRATAILEFPGKALGLRVEAVEPNVSEFFSTPMVGTFMESRTAILIYVPFRDTAAAEAGFHLAFELTRLCHVRAHDIWSPGEAGVSFSPHALLLHLETIEPPASSAP